MYLRINTIQAVVDYTNSLGLPEDQQHPINIVTEYITGIKDVLDLYEYNNDLLNNEVNN